MQNLDSKKVVLGMSGGVDSSVSLMLLKEAGYEVIGISLRYDVYKCSKRAENVCCSEESFKKAKEICEHYNCEHKIIDVSDKFKTNVIDYFTNELKNNRTPSPCVFCNPKVKFKALLDYADQIGAKYVATGHYARIAEQQFEDSSQFLLLRSKDLNKDQTYSLSFLDQSTIKRIIFPLSELTKDEVYKLASENIIFESYKKIKQSQDFCFIDKDELDSFIDKEVRPAKGKILNTEGRLIGEHEGLSHYTLGQRKKIKLPGGPYYVVDKVLPSTLIVSKNINDGFKKCTILDPINLIVKLAKSNYDVKVKTRSSEKFHNASIEIVGENIRLLYSSAEAILTPGQIAVFYIDDICLGSGVIN